MKEFQLFPSIFPPIWVFFLLFQISHFIFPLTLHRDIASLKMADKVRQMSWMWNYQGNSLSRCSGQVLISGLSASSAVGDLLIMCITSREKHIQNIITIQIHLRKTLGEKVKTVLVNQQVCCLPGANR